MEDFYDGLGHLMTIGLMFVVFGVLIAIAAGVTGKDPDELMSPRPSAIVAETQEDSDMVPLELVRKMYYAEHRYWVDIDGVAVEIEPDGTGFFYFVSGGGTSG